MMGFLKDGVNIIQLQAMAIEGSSKHRYPLRDSNPETVTHKPRPLPTIPQLLPENVSMYRHRNKKYKFSNSTNVMKVIAH